LFQGFVKLVSCLAVFYFNLFAADKEGAVHDSLFNLLLGAFFKRPCLCLTLADDILYAFWQLGHVLLLDVFANLCSGFELFEVLHRT